MILSSCPVSLEWDLGALFYSGYSPSWRRELRRWCSRTPVWLQTYGVLQGSVLSPKLFNIYMKPLGDNISFGAWCHQYMDDTQLDLSLPSDSKEAVLCQD